MKVYRKFTGCIDGTGAKPLEFIIEVDLKKGVFVLREEKPHPAQRDFTNSLMFLTTKVPKNPF